MLYKNGTQNAQVYAEERGLLKMALSSGATAWE